MPNKRDRRWDGKGPIGHFRWRARDGATTSLRAVFPLRCSQEINQIQSEAWLAEARQDHGALAAVMGLVVEEVGEHRGEALGDRKRIGDRRVGEMPAEIGLAAASAAPAPSHVLQDMFTRTPHDAAVPAG